MFFSKIKNFVSIFIIALLVLGLVLSLSVGTDIVSFGMSDKIIAKVLGQKSIDSRPSDALAIALRIHAPILVAEKVMKEAIVWEEDSLIIEDEIKQSPEMKVLEKQLQKAIDKEQYEIAARIRDKIKDIDS